MIFIRFIVVFLLSSTLFGQIPSRESVIAGSQKAFEKVSKTVAMPAPGCAIGVSYKGESVFEKAFGLAEMEHNIPNTPQTIFESGSVAKQSTAAALILLQRDGKLNIDDPVRKYIPELPDYGSPLTIRHMLNHTAGLRDWGAVMGLTGLGRGDRVISHAVAVDVILRQKHLDFVPGTEYSYSNSGYQLAAEIVERVSKQKFSAFVEQRIFEPLGMKNSSWRDDYQRVVPGRALAYSKSRLSDPWRLDMPFMNVYGNGGMLTTVGDWLKWNAMLDTKAFGELFVNTLETRGKTNGETKIAYALGLVHGNYRGVREVAHSGSTAGYQANLARYPDREVSIAVLCNGTVTSPVAIMRPIADEILGPFPTVAPPVGIQISEEKLSKFVGVWRNERTHFPSRFTLTNDKLRFEGTEALPVAEDALMIRGVRVKFSFDKDGVPVTGESREHDGSKILYRRETAWLPTADEFGKFTGEWNSDEAQAKVNFVVENGIAFVENKPLVKIPLQPEYKDHFSTPGLVVWFSRDRSATSNAFT